MRRYEEWLPVVALCVVLPLNLYLGIASAVFRWRNPTANRMTVIREFRSVLTFQKLDVYQVKGR